MQIVRSLLTVLLSTTIFLFISDQILGFAGYPSETPIKPAHPRNFEQLRKNLEFSYTFKTNDQGLRYATIPLEKSSGERRVLLLGDSFIEGAVESSETIGAHLESQFPSSQSSKVRFINGGLSGTAPREYWRLFYYVGRKYNLDGVLICIYANDVTGMPEQLSRQDLYRTNQDPPGSEIKKVVHFIYPRIYTLLHQLRAARKAKAQEEKDFRVWISEVALRKGIKEDEIARWANRLPKKLVDASLRKEFNSSIFALGLLSPFFWTDALNVDTARAGRKFHSLIVAIEEILGVARAQGVQVGLVYIPSPLQYEPHRYGPSEPWIIGGAAVEEKWLHDDSEVQKRLSGWAAEKRVPYLDLTPAFRKHHDPSRPINWVLDEHLTSYGNQLTAEAMSRWMREAKVFSFIDPHESDNNQ